ncbi:MAG: MFS transporter [Deltaproteobacteria bacterium]|nr:MFS transporter [Deltaproteobacteria bacterium]MBW2121617.1 MFS transporter [Deltaproteobacteria bacterium]
MNSRLPLKPLLILTAVYYMSFLSRIIIAPLLPLLEVEFDLRHSQAGGLFLFIAVGQCLGFLASGIVSSRLTHRFTIFASGIIVGGAMLATSHSKAAPDICRWLFLLGLGEGLYFPSGIAVLTELAAKEDWGKAMAIHELAPNLALVTAPLLAEALLLVVSWRGVMITLSISALLLGLGFLRWGRGGNQRGTPPKPRKMMEILREPQFWVVAAAFAFALGAADGLYAILPLFLVDEIGLERQFANTIIGLSHISGVFIIFFSGVVTDRIGARRSVAIFTGATAASTLMLGVFRGSLLTPALVFLQATSVACFFPPALVIASLTFPSTVRNLALSLVLITGILFGEGVMPPTAGYLAEAVSFPFAICFVGTLVLSVLGLLFFLPPSPDGD